MKHTPFCRECDFYGGRKNGVGVCNLNGKKYEAEHIKGDFWCKDGKVKGCRSCKHDGEWSNRCAYCKSNKDSVGQWTEWEPKEE